MNPRHILVALLCAGAFTVPALAAGPLTERAVSLAAQSPRASLDDVCLATYKAVKESPEEADEIFRKVIAQRADWTAGQVYGVLRAVMLARPDLAQNINGFLSSHKFGTPVDVTSDSLLPLASRLLGALVDSSLPAPLVQTVLDNLTRDSLGVTEINDQVASGQLGAGTIGLNTNAAPIPSPRPVSPQN